MKYISILGSTGSIGTQAIDVIARRPSSFRVVGLSAHANADLLIKQIRLLRPSIVAVGDESAADRVRSWCRRGRRKIRICTGPAALTEVACHPRTELVVSSVVGAAGLTPILAAIRAKKNIALANKEALVVAGAGLMALARKHGVSIIPVDSEHSAIFQCLKNENHGAVRRIFLTASGGPFYRSDKDLSAITVEEALAHPTWIMGRKITIDSATLMNKGLEAIEASYLFNVPLDRIEIVIHPQSIIHSMVEYVDGAVIAQLSMPDMRLPIQYALTWPERQPSSVRPLDLAHLSRLEFGAPDFRRFPCLKLALDAGRKGGTMPAVMNAANEVAVDNFLRGKIGFGGIPAIITSVMRRHKTKMKPTFDEVIAADRAARAAASAAAARHTARYRGEEHP